MLPLAILALGLGVSTADKQSLDCPLRQLMVDFAQKLQPNRPAIVFSELADALNGAQEAQNCSVAPTVSSASLSGSTSRMPSFPLPPSGSHVLYIDPSAGSDASAGTLGAPLLTLQAALASVRATRAAAGLAAPASPTAYLVLRAGTFYETLALTRADSRVTFQAYPREEVFLSGGVPLTGVDWVAAPLPSRPAWELRSGTLDAGFDVLPAQQLTPAAAQALCEATPACTALAYPGPATPTGPVTVSFKYRSYFTQGSSGSVWVLNRALLAGATTGLFAADVSGFAELGDIASLRVASARAVLARYPNAVNAEDLGAMQLIAQSWTAQSMGKNANYTFSPDYPSRNESINDGSGVPYFGRFSLGVGGPCAQRFTPQASYWCSEHSQGGGPGPYSAPVGMVVTNAPNSLPHSPYTGDLTRAAVHSWRAGRWFSWVFAVEGATVAGNTTTLAFSLSKGGNQGSRGGDSGQEFFIENVMDELDAPGEFYHDVASGKLYLLYNASGTPADATIVVPTHVSIVSAVGTAAEPVEDVGFKGIGFRDTAPNYLGPHGTPSGGDWAVGRAGALFFEGTVGASLDGCLLTSLDGNAVFFSGYNRNGSVTNSEFLGIGETAVVQWGYTDGSPVPGMGFNASAGNQPRGTVIAYNLVHEVGLYTKQNSFYFQSESFGNTIEGNIAYNGPRAGINFDDGMGGGSIITKNVLANFCRESSDHGPFNSWNRQVYVWIDPATGQETVHKQNDTISYNFILANYHSSMAIDNDDGSSFYDTHHNVLWSASSGAAYGGNSLKADFGGHSNFHHNNLDLFWSSGFGICGTLAGYADGYYDNYLYQAKDGNYGGGQDCSPGGTTVGGNTVWTPTGAVTECGKSLAAYQATGGDPGTTAAAYPADSVVLGIAKQLMGL